MRAHRGIRPRTGFMFLVIACILTGLAATSCGTIRTHAGINHEYEYNFDDGYYYDYGHHHKKPKKHHKKHKKHHHKHHHHDD